MLTGDDAKQQADAAAFISSHCSPENPAFVNRVVLVEIVWVLESVYSYERGQIATAVDTLLRMVRIEVEDADAARGALRDYNAGADFADTLIARTNAALGCSKTITFDRKAAKKIARLVAL